MHTLTGIQATRNIYPSRPTLFRPVHPSILASLHDETPAIPAKRKCTDKTSQLPEKRAHTDKMAQTSPSLPKAASKHSANDLLYKQRRYSSKRRSSSGGVWGTGKGMRGPAASRMTDGADVHESDANLRTLAPSPSSYTGRSAKRKKGGPKCEQSQWSPSSLNPNWPEEVQVWVKQGFTHLASNPRCACGKLSCTC